MKIKIFQETDIDLLEHKLNQFDASHIVKFTQSSSAFDSKIGVVTTVLVFHEGERSK